VRDVAVAGRDIAGLWWRVVVGGRVGAGDAAALVGRLDMRYDIGVAISIEWDRYHRLEPGRRECASRSRYCEQSDAVASKTSETSNAMK
jgi:hypothetical protein